MNKLTKLVLLPIFALMSACAMPPTNQGALQIEVTKNEDIIVVSLVNNSDVQQDVSEGYVYAGKGLGNVHAFIFSDLGQIRPVCAPMDTATDFWKESSLRPGASVEVWRGTPQHLATFSCLEKGQYTAIFGYQRPSGDILFSRPLKLLVSGERNQNSHYLEATAELGKTAAMRKSD